MFDLRPLAIRKTPFAFEYIEEVITVNNKKYYKLQNCNDIVSEDNIILNSDNWNKAIKDLQKGELIKSSFNYYINSNEYENPNILFPEFKHNIVQFTKGAYLITSGDCLKDLFIKCLNDLNNTLIDNYIYIVNYEVISNLDFLNSHQCKEVFYLTDSYTPKWSIRFTVSKYNYIKYIQRCNYLEYLHSVNSI